MSKSASGFTFIVNGALLVVVGMYAPPATALDPPAGELNVQDKVPTKEISQQDNVPLKASDRVQWGASMRATKAPKPGCFTASFPTLQWQEVSCTPPPSRLPGKKIHKKKINTEEVGNGPDIVAQAVGNPISSVRGWFGPVINVTSVDSWVPKSTNAPIAGGYSLQLNTDFFATPACAGAKTPSNCTGWVQFIFLTSEKNAYVFIELWLRNFGPTCPGVGTVAALPGTPDGTSWTPSHNNCVLDVPSVRIDPQSIIDLTKLELTGSAISGGNDDVIMTASDGTMTDVAVSDSIFSLSAAWQQAEFNVFGFNNGEEARFNDNSAAVVNLSVENGTTNAPTLGDFGFTGETNNFTFLVKPGCAMGGSNPGIAFDEAMVTGLVSHACPPDPKPAPLPPVSPCDQATKAVTIAQAQLAKAEARLSDPVCQGPPSLECHKQVQSAQNALWAAEQEKKKECP